jgi:hypothetical protein
MSLILEPKRSCTHPELEFAENFWMGRLGRNVTENGGSVYNFFVSKLRFLGLKWL